MGIIIDDELVRGAHGAAGEIGYLPLVGDPFNPRHRLHGGLEDEIGGAGIVAAFNEGRGPGDPELSSVHDVFELSAAGNSAARSVVDHVASRLGTAIATVCAILDPELVVLGGGIGASPLLLRPVRGSAAALVPITARIETSLLGERAALQGAVAVALHAARTMLLSHGAPHKSHKKLVAMAHESR
jgi:glucokinase